MMPEYIPVGYYSMRNFHPVDASIKHLYLWNLLRKIYKITIYLPLLFAHNLYRDIHHP